MTRTHITQIVFLELATISAILMLSPWFGWHLPLVVGLLSTLGVIICGGLFMWLSWRESHRR